MLTTRRLGAGMMRGYDHGGMMDGSGAWFTMLFGFVLLLALVGVTIYWIARATSPRQPTAVLPAPPLSQPPASAAPSPRDVLDLRLASGEISAEEYGATTRLLDRSA